MNGVQWTSACCRLDSTMKLLSGILMWRTKFSSWEAIIIRWWAWNVCPNPLRSSQPILPGWWRSGMFVISYACKLSMSLSNKFLHFVSLMPNHRAAKQWKKESYVQARNCISSSMTSPKTNSSQIKNTVLKYSSMKYSCVLSPCTLTASKSGMLKLVGSTASTEGFRVLIANWLQWSWTKGRESYSWGTARAAFIL